jgi:hypothetical protein
MSHERDTVRSAGDFESPTSASSVIRAEGTHSRTSPQNNVESAGSCHNPCHSFSAVERDSGDNIPRLRLLRDLGGLPSRAIRAGWSESAVWTPEAA